MFSYSWTPAVVKQKAAVKFMFYQFLMAFSVKAQLEMKEHVSD